ncbi:MAG: MFS transporter [Bacillota bacterium]
MTEDGKIFQCTIPTVKERLWTSNFVYAFFINAALFMSFHMLTPTFPFFISYLGGTDQIAGMAAAAISFSALIFRPFAGWFMDNKGRKLIFIIGLIILVTVAFYYNTVQLLLLAVLLRFVHGIGWGISTTGANTIAADTIPKGRFAEGMGYFSLTAAVSLAFAPALGLWLIERFNFNTLFNISGIFAAVAFFLAVIFRYENIKPQTPKAKSPMLKDLFSLEAIRPALIMMLSAIPFGAALSFVAVYAVYRGIENTGSFFIVLAVVSAIARIASGKIADKKGESIMVLGGLIFTLASMLSLTFCHGVVLYLISGAFLGIGFGFSICSLQTQALRNALPQRRGAASGTFLLSLDIGIGSGGLIAGWVATQVGYEAMFPSMLLPMIAALILYFIFSKRRLAKELQ